MVYLTFVVGFLMSVLSPKVSSQANDWSSLLSANRSVLDNLATNLNTIAQTLQALNGVGDLAKDMAAVSSEVEQYLQTNGAQSVPPEEHQYNRHPEVPDRNFQQQTYQKHPETPVRHGDWHTFPPQTEMRHQPEAANKKYDVNEFLGINGHEARYDHNQPPLRHEVPFAHNFPEMPSNRLTPGKVIESEKTKRPRGKNSLSFESEYDYENSSALKITAIRSPLLFWMSSSISMLLIISLNQLMS